MSDSEQTTGKDVECPGALYEDGKQIRRHHAWQWVWEGDYKWTDFVVCTTCGTTRNYRESFT